MIKWLLALLVLLPVQAWAACGVLTMQQATATSNGVAGAAVTVQTPTTPNTLYRLQNMFVICGNNRGATTEAYIIISGLAGSPPNPTYALDESNTFVSISDDFEGAPASGLGVPIVLTVPAVANGGICAAMIRFCQ
jgi:hypothetical protein